MASSMFGGIHPASRKENTRRKPLMLLEHPPAQVALPLAFHGGPSVSYTHLDVYKRQG